MNEEILRSLYDQAIARCELGEAWEFEKHFTTVILEHVHTLLIDENVTDAAINRIKEEFGIK